MATAAKLGTTCGAGLDLALRAWIDRVIVPALVREFLEQGQKVQNSEKSAEKSALLNFNIVPDCSGTNEPSAEVNR